MALPSPLHPPRARTSPHTRLGTSHLTHRALSTIMNLVWVRALLRDRLPKAPTAKKHAFQKTTSDLRDGLLEVLEGAAGVECERLGGRLRGRHVVPERPEVHRYWRGPFFQRGGGARGMHTPIQSPTVSSPWCTVSPPSRGMRVLGQTRSPTTLCRPARGTNWSLGSRDLLNDPRRFEVRGPIQQPGEGLLLITRQVCRLYRFRKSMLFQRLSLKYSMRFVSWKNSRGPAGLSSVISTTTQFGDFDKLRTRSIVRLIWWGEKGSLIK